MLKGIFDTRRGIEQLTVEGALTDVCMVYGAEWALIGASAVCCAEYNWFP